MLFAETQKGIIEFLTRHRVASCRELSEALGTTRANIQHHITILRNQGVIEPTGISQPDRRSPGRPWRYYRLSPVYEKNNYPEVLSAALNFIRGEVGECDRFMKKLAKAIAGQPLYEATPLRRMNRTLEFLNIRNYYAYWEAGQTGPKIIIKNCPYAMVLPQNPEICCLDLYLLEELTGLTCIQTTKMSLLDNSHPSCIFQLKA